MSGERQVKTGQAWWTGIEIWCSGIETYIDLTAKVFACLASKSPRQGRVVDWHQDMVQWHRDVYRPDCLGLCRSDERKFKTGQGGGLALKLFCSAPYPLVREGYNEKVIESPNEDGQTGLVMDL